jgi:hypothetical protein
MRRFPPPWKIEPLDGSECKIVDLQWWYRFPCKSLYAKMDKCSVLSHNSSTAQRQQHHYSFLNLVDQG